MPLIARRLGPVVRLMAAILFCVEATFVGVADGDVSWLADVQRPPEKPVTFELGTIKPLLVDESGATIKDTAGWARRRDALRATWLSFLGPMPAAPANNSVEFLKTETLDEGTRQLIRYECEAGLFVEAYLLTPDPKKFEGPRPGAVVLHSTTTATFDEVAVASRRGGVPIGIQLLQRGFVVMCPRCFLWQDVESLPQAVEKFRARHPQTLGMHKMLYDAQRAVDILAAQPNVNAKRLVACGHSLGAKETLYLAAFDDRIRAAVASEGGLALKSTNWDAPWYLGPAIREATFERNHHELLALMAPRAFLILGGESGPGAADGDRSWPLIDAALPVHRLFHDRPRLGLLNHHQGHSIPEDAGNKMLDWLEAYSK